jgi:UDP-N-acetyl-D-mannosaminuronic acid dehydrogenase
LHKAKKGKVVVVGVGRVGLPLALLLADRGFLVYGLDTDPRILKALRQRRMPFLEHGGQAMLDRHLGHRFIPTENVADAEKADVVILTLGTPLDEHMNPVISELERAVSQMLPFLHKGQLLILRGTVSPGTTNYFRRFLERHTRFRVGRDFGLAFCPERIAEGHALQELPEIPQLVGADDTTSRRRAEKFFRNITPHIQAGDTVSVELAKLFTNMYRYIDFAIANEFMIIAHQHDRKIHDILSLVNWKYKRGGLKQPGLTGGPCLYKDGFLLVGRSPFSELFTVSWKVNENVPAFLIEQIRTLIPLEGAKVAILGLAFKREIDDTRNSLSYKAKKIFVAAGANVFLHDPYVPSQSLEKVLHGADVVFLAMNHRYYLRRRKEIAKLSKRDAVVCDVWNSFLTGKIIYRVGDLRV